MAQFSLYVHTSGLKSDLFHFIWISAKGRQVCTDETVPKPNVLLVDHMYGERQEQWQTLRTVARHASQVVKSTRVQNRPMED